MCSTRRVFVATIIAVGLFGSQLAQAQEYAVTDLGLLFSNDDWSTARGINHAGRAVGISYASPPSPFIWENGMLRNLGGLGQCCDALALDINQAMQVVGGASDGTSGNMAVIWENESIRRLGTLGGRESVAYAINNKGQIVGWSETTRRSRPFLWDNGEMRNLGILGGTVEGSATDINDATQVVGVSRNAGLTRAFLWEYGVMIDLGTLGGKNSDASGINQMGQVVGDAFTAAGVQHAFIWEAGEMTDLGTLASAVSYATAINDSSQVVGNYYVPSTAHEYAFRWMDGTIENLNDFIPSSSGWDIRVAYDINNAGQITGLGRLNGEGRAFLLTPIVCNGFIAGDANCDGAVDALDVEPLILALFEPEQYGEDYPLCNWLCNLDGNRDGTVDSLDIEPFLDLLFP